METEVDKEALDKAKSAVSPLTVAVPGRIKTGTISPEFPDNA